MRIVVTGGAGYIGAHVARALCDRGADVTIVDDLSGGSADRVAGVPLHRIDLADPRTVPELVPVLTGVDVVAHFAARKSVGESVRRPAWYYQQNLGGMANLLLAVERAEVPEVLFSSSAAVYGATEGLLIREDRPTAPINPYGATKLAGEQLLAATSAALGLRSASLRYFNAAGTADAALADTAATNLIPIVVRQIQSGIPPTIFGDDYATPDGTAIRDYIHVLDLVDAHLAAIDHLAVQPAGHHVFNVGTGVGTSVAEVIAAVSAQADHPVTPRITDRRPGDPAVAVADASLIGRTVGWSARRTLDDIVTSVWRTELDRSRPVAPVEVAR